jgi:hypothetical protein
MTETEASIVAYLRVSISYTLYLVYVVNNLKIKIAESFRSRDKIYVTNDDRSNDLPHWTKPTTRSVWQCNPAEGYQHRTVH